jgi:damage-control phosphatase, subfamily I
MKTQLDCIPCFFRQALVAARISGAGRIIQKNVLKQVAGNLPGLSLQVSPPEIARRIYRIVSKATRQTDPYRKMKEQSNRLALRMYPALRRGISDSGDRLHRAVELAIAGNIIDYGVNNSLNIQEELKRILNPGKQSFGKGNTVFIHYRDFKDTLSRAKNILYLGDNAGETVFDRILIEELIESDPYKKIIYAVRESPIINDALIEDAYQSGIHKIATVVSSGSDAPGTILSLCSKDFLKMYRSADMVISKGQGNFETLSDEKKPIFFMLRAKCTVVADHIGCSEGEVLLLSNRKMKKKERAVP